jgi:hypothetical protein
MKRCPKCERDKSLTDFNRNRKRSDGLQDHCRSCDNAANRAWYNDNKERALIRIERNKKIQRTKCNRYVLAHKQANPCQCGESRPAALTFHHRDREAKVGNVSDLASVGSYQKMVAEIEKCDVMCWNCHMILTAEEFGFVSVYDFSHDIETSSRVEPHNVVDYI